MPQDVLYKRSPSAKAFLHRWHDWSPLTSGEQNFTRLSVAYLLIEFYGTEAAWKIAIYFKNNYTGRPELGEKNWVKLDQKMEQNDDTAFFYLN